MAKSKERLRALKLRRRGMSIKSIAEELVVSKSSASTWCREIDLTEKQINRLHKNSVKGGMIGRLLGAKMNRDKKVAAIEEAKIWAQKTIGQLSSRDFMIAGVALYWGEGSKKSTGTTFCNSDPKMILFMYKWFINTFMLRETDIKPQIFINSIHKDRSNDVLTFWSSLLELPSGQFGNTVFLRVNNKKKYENHESYFGVLSLRVLKGTIIKYKILGMIDQLK